MKHLNIAVLLTLLFLFVSCADKQKEITVDSTQLLEDLKYLASDELEGRRTGTEGNAQARRYVKERFVNLGLKMFGDSYRQQFEHTNRRSGEVFENAINLIGFIEGRENPDEFIVITAHYDHLGVRDGEIYNGADDNASGTAALMAAARWFTENPPANSIMFIAFDAEEQGLGGARYFVENSPIPLEHMVMNINMDMISNNFENELYAVGTHHYGFLKPFVEVATANASVDVLFGFDSDEYAQDWTMSSDHGPFHTKGVPFIYFGVEDHPHYHAPSDTYENTNPEFYIEAVKTILGFMEHADENLAEIRELSGR